MTDSLELLVFLLIVGGVIVGSLAFVVLGLLEALRTFVGFGLQRRWIEVFISVVVAIVAAAALAYVGLKAIDTDPVDAGSSVSNAPGP